MQLAVAHALAYASRLLLVPLSTCTNTQLRSWGNTIIASGSWQWQGRRVFRSVHLLNAWSAWGVLWGVGKDEMLVGEEGWIHITLQLVYVIYYCTFWNHNFKCLPWWWIHRQPVIQTRHLYTILMSPNKGETAVCSSTIFCLGWLGRRSLVPGSIGRSPVPTQPA